MCVSIHVRFCVPYLLLEVAPLLLIYEHQVEVVAHRELLVGVFHGRRHLIAGQEQPDGDGLACSSDSMRQIQLH